MTGGAEIPLKVTGEEENERYQTPSRGSSIALTSPQPFAEASCNQQLSIPYCCSVFAGIGTTEIS